MQSRVCKIKLLSVPLSAKKQYCMETFFRTHQYLIKHAQTPIERKLMQEINWDHRLIGIKGSRGVGKTSFLLAYAKKHFAPNDRSCLYINMNHLYFTSRTLYEFALEFHLQGGRVLLIDQIFKYPNWSSEVKRCYQQLPSLKIVFTGSSMMRLKEENPELVGLVHSYILSGFSFREYLMIQTGHQFQSYTWDELLKKHTTIVASILEKVNPLDHFQDYLHHGYYPFFLEKRNFSENLLKTINMTLEVDVLLIQQIELKYLWKIKCLLYLMATQAPYTPNISQLSTDIETSRATIMNYIKYLTDARLVNLLYNKQETFPKKPVRVYLQNTNLIYALDPHRSDRQSLCETFAFQMLKRENTVTPSSLKQAQFLVNKTVHLSMIDDTKRRKQQKSNLVYLCDQNSETAPDMIPLWLLGFLY